MFSGWISAKLALMWLISQFALLAASTVFYNILAQVCAEIKILSWFLDRKVTYFFLLFDFFFFLPFLFLLLFAAVIGLLLGVLAVKKTSKKVSSRQAIFTME